MPRRANKTPGLNERPNEAVLPLEERVRQALERSKKAATDLVFVEVAAGLTFCKIANRIPRTEEKFRRHMKQGWTALRVADKYMWQLGIRNSIK